MLWAAPVLGESNCVCIGTGTDRAAGTKPSTPSSEFRVTFQLPHGPTFESTRPTNVANDQSKTAIQIQRHAQRSWSSVPAVALIGANLKSAATTGGGVGQRDRDPPPPCRSKMSCM